MTRNTGTADVPSRALVICDDRKEIRRALRSILTGRPGLTIVGEAWDSGSCADVVRNQHPDILILDVNLPGVGGIQTAKDVKAMAPDTCIIAYSGRHEPFVQEAMLAAGAEHFVLKSGRISPLLRAIDAALQPHAHIPAP